MLTLPEHIAFALLVLVSAYLSWKTFSTLIRVINRGQGKLFLNGFWKRLGNALIIVVTQKTVLKTRLGTSILHALIAWAFMLYFLVNLGDILNGYIPNFHFMGGGELGNVYRLFVDFFSVFALIPCPIF